MAEQVDVEIEAPVAEEVLTEGYMARFGGMGRLYGLSGLRRLAAAHVCVVGVGGVGSWTAEALARSGVGALTLIDLDDVCINNTNRQLHTLEQTVGMQKVDVLAARILQINPECRVTAISEFFMAETAEALISAELDFVVDAIDHMRNKALLIATCKRLDVPIVVVGGAGGRRDATRLEVADLSRTGADGLLRHTRRTLRQEYGFEADGEWGIPCVFSREPAVYPTPEGEVCEAPPEGSSSVRLDCASGFGAATFVTGTAGFMAAGVAVSAIAAGR